MKLVNNTARFTHGIAILFAIGCALAILAVFMRGPPEGFSQSMTWLVLGLFGAAAVGVLVYANATAAIGIELCSDKTLLITERTWLIRRCRSVCGGDVRGVFIEQSEDQDGAAYFRAVLCLNDGSRFVVREGHDQHQIGEAADLVQATLR